ncbi:MAG: phage major capsid protein, partial [Planctomycetales bacterium]|nr:phage major capsid protein [Planctomycetales bacterium]
MDRVIAGLKRRKAALLAHSENILAAAEKEGRESNAFESVLLKSNEEELAAGAKAVAAQEALNEFRRVGMSVRETGFETGFPGQLDGDRSGAATADDAKPSVKGRVGAKFSDLFPQASCTGPQMSSREFFGAVASGVYHPKLLAMKEGSGASGGWIVPEQVTADYLGAAYENSLVLPRATIYPMTGPTLKIGGFDASSAEDKTLFGGMTWLWLPEEGTGTPSNPKFRKVQLTARKLAIFATASNELVEDGLSLETQLESAMRTGSGWALDYSFLRGTGAGEPRGVLNDPALVVVAKEVGQDATSLVYENLIKMLARLHPACFANSIWIANPTCIPSLLTLCAPAGLGGQPLPVLRESGGGWNLLTRPMVF